MKSALIIGNTHYADPQLAQLQAPAADAQALAELLRAPEIGGCDDVRALLDCPFAEVHPAIADFFADRKPDDLLLLYFSGHGVLDPQGRLYLALPNTRRDRLSGSALASHFIEDEMDNSRARRQVLILDCCYSGAFARGAKAAAGAPALTDSTFDAPGRGRVVLTATDTTQYAFEGDAVLGQTANSLFTHFVLEGLQTGAADLDGDGRITPEELYNYVYQRVVQATPAQKPRLITYEREGEIVIAHAPRRAPPPAALPPELQQAAASPFASIRLGAVPELANILAGPDLALAAAARLALQKLVDDDRHKVSGAVAQALQTEKQEEQGRRKKQAASRKQAEEEATLRGNAAREAELLLTLAPGAPLELVRIPAGEFLMGSDKTQDKDAYADETPQHKLALPEYLLGKYPVTVAQFAAFVAAAGYQTTAEKQGSGYSWTGSEWKEIKGANWQHPRGPQSDVKQKQNHPVTLISWDDAIAFCQWASKITGRAVRLPTEAEWEKAARGGLELPSPQKGEGPGVRVYPWGNQPPTDKLVSSQ